MVGAGVAVAVAMDDCIMRTDEISQAAATLGKLSAGFVPPALFRQFARLAVLPSFVVVPLFRRGAETYVRLTQRDMADIDYPGQWHPPGTVVRPTDETLPAVFERLGRSELSEMTIVKGPIFFDIAFAQIIRGRELSLLHWIEIADDHAPGCFPVGALPSTTIDTDIPRISGGRSSFRASCQPST